MRTSARLQVCVGIAVLDLAQQANGGSCSNHVSKLTTVVSGDVIVWRSLQSRVALLFGSIEIDLTASIGSTISRQNRTHSLPQAGALLCCVLTNLGLNTNAWQMWSWHCLIIGHIAYGVGWFNVV